jgi:hypothetical protein
VLFWSVESLSSSRPELLPSSVRLRTQTGVSQCALRGNRRTHRISMMSSERGGLADGEMDGSCSDGEVWTEPCDPPELRRFFDLAVECSVGRMMWVQCNIPLSFRAVLTSRLSVVLVSRIVSSIIRLQIRMGIGQYATNKSEDSRNFYYLFRIRHDRWWGRIGGGRGKKATGAVSRGYHDANVPGTFALAVKCRDGPN